MELVNVQTVDTKRWNGNIVVIQDIMEIVSNVVISKRMLRIIDKEEYKMRYEYLEEWVKDEPEKYKDDFITYQSNCLNLPDEVKTIKINKW